MKTDSLKSGFFILGVLLQLSIFAQKPLNYRFQYLLIEDGLPQNTINSIAKDAYGFMWFGTNNGISRFDGYSFESFKSDENLNNALPDNMISSIEPGEDNLLWIGSSNGLSYFDPQKGHIVKFTCDSISEQISKVSSIVSNKNELWIGTTNAGIYLLVRQAAHSYKLKQHFTLENSTLTNNTINTVYLSRNNKLYIGTPNEALYFDSKNSVFVSEENGRNLPQNTYVFDIYESQNNDLYITTFYGMAVIWHNTLLPEYFLYSSTNKNSIAHNIVHKVIEDANGTILVGSLGGLQIFDTYSGKFYSLPEEGPENFRLNNQFVSTLFSDETGNVWIGTEKGGINKFNVFQNQFDFYTYDPNNSNSLNENTINSILKEKEALWVGTAGGGLNKLNLKTGKFSHIKNDALNPSTLSSDYVTSIVRGDDGNLWVGTWGGGLNSISTSKGKTTVKPITNTTPGYRNEIVNYFVSSMVNDNRGFLLIGTEGGLSTLDYKTHKFTTLTISNDSIPQLSEIGCILLDSKGYYWLGTRNGLFRFPANSIRNTTQQSFEINQIQFFNSKTISTNPLPGDYIIALTEDKAGNIWVGTYGNGVAKCTVDINGGLFCKNYSQADGLSNNVIYGIQEDQNNNMWFSTDFGLSMFDTKSTTFRNFFKQDGLLNNQFYWSASYKSADGELYFGGTEGLNYFKPENILTYQYIPTPKITKFTIFNKEVFPQQKFHDKVVINKPIYTSDTIQLTYRDNNISFDFSAFDYYLPEKASFSYMLTEIDKDWITVPAERRFANYSNLSGGTYQLMIKASNCDGIWNEKPTIVTLIITPPFWRTQWFRILLIVTVLMLTFFLIQLQMRRIIQQKKLLEQKVKIRTKKIEDQNIILENQASELMDSNHQLERRQKQIEQQKEELENKNNEILNQRDELILLNNKVKDINQQQLRFFTNISHEFRTPLTLIISPLERLLDKFKNDQETGNIVKIINRNANRLLMLINQLLEIRKIETGNQELQVELTDTKSFLQEICASFQTLATKNNITFTNKIEVNNVAWIDKEKMENVMYNLLSNAFKFTPEQKNITLTATNFKRNENDFLKISIKDEGIGIPEKEIGKLYDRFYQVTESKSHVNRGTGIGLSLVKSLLDIMYGTIHVESKPGEGSTFIIQIPVNKQFFADHEIDTTGQTFESNIKNKVAILYDQIKTPAPINVATNESLIENILVIEDNHDMRSFICSSLSQYYKVYEAENGRVGYEMAKELEPALIISDIMMPEMNGLEFCKKIKNNLYTSHIPIILLTAKGKVEDFVEGLEYGADDYISKPFSIEIVIAKVNGLIENRKKLRNKFSSLEEVNTNEITTSTLDNQFFEKVNTVVEKYYTDSTFDVDHFASVMFVSRSQLYKKLKAITNFSANDFINVYRLKKSVELLKKGELQISEIAYATGFNDPKYFSRVFKKFYKKSPSEFIQKTSN
ncbi:MAG: response regulator [Prolixibacteraceae bacterium]|jgi:signal transduction histidine kinase/ligand-binding sensor domain-containing protein/DNA-binding response OmpR family regulator|nr:response regulator [Prolixibacteraceae bacterium]